jgi:HAD superfamily hydrolase (TIGR01509 family)
VNEAIALWSSSPGRVDTSVLDLLRCCRRDAKRALVTNGTTRLPADLERLGLTAEFDYIFNSAQLGVIKPDPGLFVGVLEALQLEPSSVFFVDDNVGHVGAAQKLGIAGHCYRGVEGLRLALLRRDLLEPGLSHQT